MSEDPNSSILRGVRTLVGLAEFGTPVSTAVLASALDLPPSSAHRLLTALKQAGYVQQDTATGAFGPGDAFLRAATVFAAMSGFPQGVQVQLAALRDEVGESSFYGAYLSEMSRFRFLAQLFSDQAVQYVGRKDRHYSLLWGASGRSIAAFLPDKTVKAIYDREKATQEGREALPGWNTFKDLLAQIRDNGYSASANQRVEGAHAIAAPVFGAGNEPVGSIGISMPASRRDERRIEPIARLVMSAAARLSAAAQSLAPEPS